MRWYHYVAYFFGGAFIANFVPHFVNGIAGNPFQSPFASPPGRTAARPGQAETPVRPGRARRAREVGGRRVDGS